MMSKCGYNNVVGIVFRIYRFSLTYSYEFSFLGKLLKDFESVIRRVYCEQILILQIAVLNNQVKPRFICITVVVVDIVAWV
jgi:hypothetical protein